jgi:hypothetical protein
MKRFLAITASVVMICVAIVIRSSIDSGGSGTTPSSGPITIACVTELATECKKLSNVTVRVEEASVTAKAIAAGTADIDGWVTFDPWPEMTNALARASVTGETKAMAASPLEIAMVRERAEALAPTCGGAVNWKCLGDAIGKQWKDVGGHEEWGPVKAGIPPTSSALGLLTLGNAASGYFGRTDFATNDFDSEFVIWRANVIAAPAAFSEFILKFPAVFSAVGATDREIVAGRGNRDVSTITPNPSASAIVLLASVDSTRAAGKAGDLTKLLRDSGWGPVPPSSGLPNAGVLLALSGLTG